MSKEQEDLIKLMRQGTWVILTPVDPGERKVRYYLKETHASFYKERINKRTVEALLKAGRLQSNRKGNWNVITLSEEEAALGYIIGTCGHIVKAKARPIEIKDTDPDGNHIIRVVLYCGPRHFNAMAKGRVLLIQSQKDAWLSEEVHHDSHR